MFIGHFALGFAAKRVAPRLSLAALFAAAQLADTLWPVLVGAGVEQVRIDPGNTAMTPLDFVSYPYSHSLLTLVVWGVVFAYVAQRGTRVRLKPGTTAAKPHEDDATIFLLIALLVVSHWVLDFVTHRPDMPIYPGGPKVGLGLWNSIPATIGVESLMFAAGVWIYASATRPRDAIGRWAFVTLVSFLVVVYAGNIAGGAPPSVNAIVIAGIVGAALLILWAWWADRHRTPTVSRARG
jgi:hypothetical protein